MSRFKKVTEHLEHSAEKVVEEAQQAVDSAGSFAKKEIEEDVVNEAIEKDIQTEMQKAPKEQVVVQKSGGKGLALVALLVALAVGGAGHYMANKKFAEVESQIQAVSAKANQPTTQTMVEMPNFENEKAQIAELVTEYQKALERIKALETAQNGYTQQISSLQLQLQKLNNTSGSDNTFWLLSEADFLLNNAARKVVLDNDIETAKNLLLEADQVLSKAPNTIHIREAIKTDLNTLTALHQIQSKCLNAACRKFSE